MIYHVVLRRGYEDVSGLVVGFVYSSQSVLCAEHQPDDEEKTIHCHVVIESNVGPEAIRKRIKNAGFDGRGQYAIMEKTKKTREPYDKFKLLRYVLKGLELNNPQVSFLKYHYGYGDEAMIKLAKEDWKVENVKERPVAAPEKKKKATTHYGLIKEIYAEANKTTRLVRDEFGNVIHEQCIENSVATWHLMCKKLNENEVRTSSHELERFYVTLLRHDPLHQENLYLNLSKKLGW